MVSKHLSLEGGEAADRAIASDEAYEEFNTALLSFYDYRFVKCAYSVWSGIRLEQGTRSASIGFMNGHFEDMFLIDIIGIVSLSTSVRDLFDAVDLYNSARIQKRE